MSSTRIVTVDDMEIGMRSTYRTRIDQQRIDDYAAVTEDYNPIHVDAEYAAGTPFGTTIAHGMLTAGLFQHPLTALTTPGGVSTEYHIRMVSPVAPGTEVEAFAECVDIDPARRRARFRVGVVAIDADARPLIEGEAEIAFPRSR